MKFKGTNGMKMWVTRDGTENDGGQLCTLSRKLEVQVMEQGN